jgi:hypothetical protein
VSVAAHSSSRSNVPVNPVRSTTGRPVVWARLSISRMSGTPPPRQLVGVVRWPHDGRWVPGTYSGAAARTCASAQLTAAGVSCGPSLRSARASCNAYAGQLAGLTANDQIEPITQQRLLQLSQLFWRYIALSPGIHVEANPVDPFGTFQDARHRHVIGGEDQTTQGHPVCGKSASRLAVDAATAHLRRALANRRDLERWGIGRSGSLMRITGGDARDDADAEGSNPNTRPVMFITSFHLALCEVDDIPGQPGTGCRWGAASYVRRPIDRKPVSIGWREESGNHTDGPRTRH